MRRRKSRDEIFINSVKEDYLDFVDFIENPGKRGYLGLIYKLKPQARELIKAYLLDRKIEIYKDFAYIKYKMKHIIEKYEEKYSDE